MSISNNSSIYYFYSMADLLADEAAEEIVKKLTSGGEYEISKLEGPNPDIEEILVCGGSMSFFGTKRLVYLRNLIPSSYSDKDLKELYSIFDETENAIYIITSTFDEKKQLTGKRVKGFLEFCQKHGKVSEERPLTKGDILRLSKSRAASFSSEITEEAAELLSQIGLSSRTALYNTIDKLAAITGYSTIDADTVSQNVSGNLEANVFEILDKITRKDAKGALSIIHNLLLMKEDPVKITASLLTGFTDMIRVRTAPKTGGTRKAAEDFHYYGSDYRLRKSLEAANRFGGVNEISNGIHILRELDKQLKSSQIDTNVQLQVAICELCARGKRIG